jgi:hypothetical protein
MGGKSLVQQALLKPAFARLYPGVTVNEWHPAALMLELANASRQHPRQQLGTTPGLLNLAHFELRGTASAGSQDAARERRFRRS